MGAVEYMQGGALGISLYESDIHSVHPRMPGDAICSLYAKCHGTLSFKTDPVTGVRNGSFMGEDNNFRFTDFIHPTSPVFVRRVDCFDKVSFGISTPMDVSRRVFQHKEDYSMLLSSVAGNIYITLRGKAAFTPDGCISFGTGRSEMIICSLTGDDYAGFPGMPPETSEVYEAVMASSDARIKTVGVRDIVNRITGGGVLHSFADCNYHTIEQCEAVEILCGVGLTHYAKGLIESMLRVYNDLGYLPMIYGERAMIDPFPAIRTIYLAKAVAYYYHTTLDNRFVRSVLPAIAAGMHRICAYAKNGYLPHLGDEGVTGKDLFTPSEKNKELFIHTAEAVLDMSERLGVRISCGSALRSAIANLEKGDMHPPRPSRSLTTLCEGCGEHHICYLSKGGAYLCPRCCAK